MKISKLEDKSKHGFFQKIKQVSQSLDHYMNDLVGYLMGEQPMHNHKLTSKDNLLEHSTFY